MGGGPCQLHPAHASSALAAKLPSDPTSKQSSVAGEPTESLYIESVRTNAQAHYHCYRAIATHQASDASFIRAFSPYSSDYPEALTQDSTIMDIQDISQRVWQIVASILKR